MTPFTTLSSALVPLPAANIDTDQIVPAQYVNVQGQKALNAALFCNLKAADPDFVLNRAELRGRKLLLTGPNFGCGSSREAAAWALSAAGFRALIGTSFNETFWNNCVKNGILPVSLAPGQHQALSEGFSRNPDMEVCVDLTQDKVSITGGEAYAFQLDPFVRELLLNGTDELDYLLERMPEIRLYEAASAVRAP